MDKRN